MKLHTETISWLVQLLVKGTTEKSNEAWDQEFHQLHQEVNNRKTLVFHNWA